MCYVDILVKEENVPFLDSLLANRANKWKKIKELCGVSSKKPNCLHDVLIEWCKVSLIDASKPSNLSILNKALRDKHVDGSAFAEFLEQRSSLKSVITAQQSEGKQTCIE